MSKSNEKSFAHSMSREALGSFSSVEGGDSDTVPSKSASTRDRILLAAFDEIYENGFQGMRIEHVLSETGLAKGALYHHFSSKKELGYAVVDEVLFAAFKRQLSALDDAADPMEHYCNIMLSNAEQCSERDVSRGCPLNNLAQEMSGLDEGFQRRLSDIFDYWHGSLVSALSRGKKLGQIQTDVNEDIVATFIMSAMQGCIGTAKCMQSPEMFRELLQTLRGYITSLRV